jgi:hypothetical protein
MSRLILVIATFLIVSTATAQVSPVGPGGGSGRGRERISDGACPRLYYGFSTGMNNAVGIFGPQFDVAIDETFSLGTGFGISSWGYKLFGEGRFYFGECNRGWALGAGVTYNTGIRDIVLKDQETMGGRQDIAVELHPQTNVMLSAYRFFNLGRRGRNRWHLQAGASIPTSKKKFTQLDGPPLSGIPTEQLRTNSPGGLVLGIGFSFGAGGF